MCTVTVLADADGVRLLCNRDEQHTRTPARLPERRICGERTAIYPVDPRSDGTWIGVNDAGLIATVLNGNPPEPRVPGHAISRGGLVPAVLAADNENAITAITGAIAWQSYAPFRLVAVLAQRLWWWRWDGIAVSTGSAELTTPQLFTSSGLGDHLVEGPRQELFAQTLLQQPDRASQDAFHRHHWPDRRELSVCMWRDDAASVSLTDIQVGAHDVRVRYHGAPPDQPATAHEFGLARA